MTSNDNNFLANLIVSYVAIFSMNTEINSRNVIKYALYGHPEDHYIDFSQGRDQFMVQIGVIGDGKYQVLTLYKDDQTVESI